MRRFFVLILFLALGPGARADEGMWLPSRIASRIGDMRSKGYRLAAGDIYDENGASLKDAIVRFGSGCTGEVISAEGLLLTNHHCGYGQIQSHSSVEYDYLTHGFWAMDRAGELPNPGLTVAFLVRMEDVTGRVLGGGEREKNIKEIEENAVRGTHYTSEVKPLYYGNSYFLYVYEVFEDVRLVAAPPSSIGKFGGDTDNWMWPRHTGDFSVFRIYAGRDNKPAPYSPDNVPYRPKKFFEISTKGVKEGDFTFVYGFPGRTAEYLLSDAVDHVLNHSNPVKIRLRTMRLDIIGAARQADPAIRIAYAAKQANIANAWKKWQGESLGLKRLGTIDKKRAYEERFVRWAADRPPYGDVVPALRAQYDSLLKYASAHDYYTEAVMAVELFARAVRFSVPDAAAGGPKDNMEAFYRDYSPDMDRAMARRLMAEYVTGVPREFVPAGFVRAVDSLGSVDAVVDHIFDRSALVSPDRYAAAKPEDLRRDPAVIAAGLFYDTYKEKIAVPYTRHNDNIAELYRTYMKGIMEFDGERAFYPDANSTLRVAYGRVEGYKPRDGVYELPVSTLDGIMEKDDPGIYDYDIPQKLRDLYASGDYGRWARGGTVPVAFLGTNHTTGGNSGSPVLNGRGQLVGLNFDRTWLSTMSDMEFDPAMCRNIAVDIRYVLLVIDRIGGAGYLLDEMAVR